MKKNLLTVVAVVVAMMNLMVSCGSDDDNGSNFKWPVGQWIYEGSGLVDDVWDAVLFDISADGPTNILGRAALNGKWYDYPLTGTYKVSPNSATGGTISYAGKVYTFRLTDSTLTLTLGGEDFVFRRTSGIKSMGDPIIAF